MKESKASYRVISPCDSKTQLYIGFEGEININVQNSQAVLECEVTDSQLIFFFDYCALCWTESDSS